MYRPSRFEKEEDFPAKEIILDIFGCYPKTYQEYQDNKKEVKEKIAVNMQRLKEFLLDDENRARFFNRAIFCSPLFPMQPINIRKVLLLYKCYV